MKIKENNFNPIISGEYILHKEEIAACEIEVLRRDVCPSLVSCGVYFEGELVHITPRVSGLVSLSSLLSGNFIMPPVRTVSLIEPPEYGLRTFRAWLAALRYILEGLATLEEYLVSERSASLDSSYIFFHPTSGQAKLLLKPRKEDWLTSVLDLCEHVGTVCEGTEGGLVASKLRRENDCGLLDFGKVLRFLSSWEMELG